MIYLDDQIAERISKLCSKNKITLQDFILMVINEVLNKLEKISGGEE